MMYVYRNGNLWHKNHFSGRFIFWCNKTLERRRNKMAKKKKIIKPMEKILFHFLFQQERYGNSDQLCLHGQVKIKSFLLRWREGDEAWRRQWGNFVDVESRRRKWKMKAVSVIKMHTHSDDHSKYVHITIPATGTQNETYS